MTPACHCPQCGFALVKDEIKVKGGWEYDPRGVVFFDNKTIGLSQNEAFVVGSIFSAAGRPLARATILAAMELRFGSGAETLNIVDVYLSRARTKARRLGLELPIRNRRGAGPYWADGEFSTTA